MNVLLPVSLAESPAELATMQAFVERMGGTLVVLHVGTAMMTATMPMVSTGLGFPGGGPEYIDPALVDSLDRADAAAFVAFCNTHFPGVTDRRLRHGDPATAILDEVGSGGIDAVLMGHRHHGFFERLVSGSVARAVLEQAPCPVIVVPIAE